MAKPWARYEIGFINHPKFRALNPNAICLWWECKNYCDEFHTDGIVPTSVTRGFRFYSAKAMALLTRSCGTKPNSEPYAPLWEALDIGSVPHLRMHDYLDHNDCRDEVLARLEDAEDRAEIRRIANNARQLKFRTERRAKLDTLRGHAVTEGVTRCVTDGVTRNDITPLSRTPTEAPTETPTQTKETRTTTTTRPAPRSSAVGPLPGFPRLRVFAWMVQRFVESLGSTEFNVEDWLLSIERDGSLLIPADDQERWKWLRLAFDFELRQRGLLRSVDSDAAELQALVAKGPSIRPHQVPR